MLSSDDLETLIVSKKREIEREKTLLGVIPSPSTSNEEENKENINPNIPKKVVFLEPSPSKPKVLESRNLSSQQDEDPEEKEREKRDTDNEKKIPPDLERYIRRYIGIPAMLKAGEYSPNNPLLRAELGNERNTGDAFLGLGEYERRRNTLRKIRQAQYRQYLDQQAKKKQEAKEQAERERKDREEKERQREERERQLLLERDRYSPERRRASVCSVPIGSALMQTTKVDTGVQVEGVCSPLSVAVQTDDVDLYQVSPSPSKCVTQAERELSPRTVATHWGDRPERTPPATHWGDRQERTPPATHWGDRPERTPPATHWGDRPERTPPATHWGDRPERTPPATHWGDRPDTCERRRSYGDHDDRTCSIKSRNRDKLMSDLRHSYMPAILDADAIHMRNQQAEKEAAARRQFYQQELRHQIQEQQRIREERNAREKMLEQAEMRRLEEQLRMLRLAHERERDKQHHLDTAMKENTKDFDTKRTELQREIDIEQQKLLRSTSQPLQQAKRNTTTSNSDTARSKLPFYYTEKTFRPIEKGKKPYSFNVPDNSVFSSNYDVDTYLRKNLNFRDKIDAEIDNIGSKNGSPKNQHVERNTSTDNSNSNNKYRISNNVEFERKMPSNSNKTERNIIIEKALIHEPKERKVEKVTYDDLDNISIPVLRHSPQKVTSSENNTQLSDAMKKVDDKWKVPAVQKNILKSLPNDQGKSVSILTQLGSIRRQLQLEQLKLDKMFSNND